MKWWVFLLFVTSLRLQFFFLFSYVPSRNNVHGIWPCKSGDSHAWGCTLVDRCARDRREFLRHMFANNIIWRFNSQHATHPCSAGLCHGKALKKDEFRFRQRVATKLQWNKSRKYQVSGLQVVSRLVDLNHQGVLVKHYTYSDIRLSLFIMCTIHRFSLFGRTYKSADILKRLIFWEKSTFGTTDKTNKMKQTGIQPCL